MKYTWLLLLAVFLIPVTQSVMAQNASKSPNPIIQGIQKFFGMDKSANKTASQAGQSANKTASQAGQSANKTASQAGQTAAKKPKDIGTIQQLQNLTKGNQEMLKPKNITSIGPQNITSTGPKNK